MERSKDIIINKKYEPGTNINEIVNYPIHLFYLVFDLMFIRGIILWPEKIRAAIMEFLGILVKDLQEKYHMIKSDPGSEMLIKSMSKRPNTS